MRQTDGHFINAVGLVEFLNDRARFDIAKEGDFLLVFLGQSAFAAADQDIGLDTNFPQARHALLCWLGLEFPGSFEVRHQRQVDEETILFADLESKLPNGFEKRQAFDVAHRAANFGNHHIHLGPAHGANRCLDFVRNVRDDLHRLAEIFPPAFFLDHRQVNPTGREVAIAV
ncbi:hypothetical protein HRbin36_01575 [bacterium HR36]|nr:hypothetical protein HRbin36_01575 [bacterium HR36]